MDKILVKYLLAETSVDERNRVERWLDEKTANRQYYQQLKAIWEESRRLEPELDVDETAAWHRFERRLEAASTDDAANLKRDGVGRVFGLSSWKSRSVAAAVALLVTIAAGLIFVLRPFGPTRLIANNEVTTDVLPDRSRITLNKHASLQYRKSFNKENRSVRLDGEAFFEIQPDKTLPFEVRVDAVTITVVGTAFNVKEDAELTEIIVEHGVVQVESAGEALLLRAGEKAEVDRKTGRLTLYKNKDKLYQYYRTREFICNETPLFELVDALSKTYNRDIIIENPKAAGMKITTRFYQEDLDDILQVIASTLNLEIKHQQNKIILN